MRARMIFMGVVMSLVLVVGMATAEAKRIPKVTNFVVLVDQSGSMFEKHITRGQTKASLAKAALINMNQQIPPLGYTAALQVLSPAPTLTGPEVYSESFFGKAIQGLQERVTSTDREEIRAQIVENLTPLGPAILHLDNIMKNFSGKTAVILVSDGRANRGVDPLKAARQIRNEYTNLCFHVIAVADDEKGKKTLEDISGLCNGAYVRAGDLVSDPSLMDHFIREVFYLDVEEEVTPLVVTPPPAPETVPETITLQGAFFDFDKFNIKTEYYGVLNESVDKLRAHPDVQIIVEGHTDSTGPEFYNQGLSERRAKAVYDYLLGKGISADRVKTVGYGESMPKISNLTKEGRAINRRVELVVVQ